jgi:hypothetical protein
MIEEYLKRKGIKLNRKGQRWADNLEGLLLLGLILLAGGVVGSIESGKWFG